MDLASLKSRLHAASIQARSQLLAARHGLDHWLGELSSSPLSPATAACALSVVARAQPDWAKSGAASITDLAWGGLDWLSNNLNADGGWGDTVLSLSNISTTALGWAAYGVVPGADRTQRACLDRVESWLIHHADGLEPEKIVPAITRRYGKDRTFSVPILTMCAISGRLGLDEKAWDWVAPLPFELAACPHQWYSWLQLPVVSYALPALIAIGQVRYYHRPPRSPAVRLLRHWTRKRTLAKLAQIQPASGGFIEATPLTSFVVMSLADAGNVNHPVTRKGIEFLVRSARPDGSWPIDTNLATWVTTLSVNALRPFDSHCLTLETRAAIRAWLMAQQYRREHPYTHAAPGGWAWTPLSGGVPDADDTAGALLALHRLGGIDGAVREAACAGINWLLKLQNRDGGIPTFCRGWGALPFDRSSADLTAHALRAWLVWRPELPNELQTRVNNALARALSFLARVQRADGAWLPLWFGNQFVTGDENPTYGTARVLQALSACAADGLGNVIEPLNQGVQWLAGTQRSDGSWGGGPGAPASIEETALAVEALAEVLASPFGSNSQIEAVARPAVCGGAAWLVDRVETRQWTQPSPIGFYFAKLWYYERLYPLIFTAAALRACYELTSQTVG
ncbi:MAG: squalene--hopene cyclase [Candidatus Omnitrophica bacterium]|nr:squalene--hopene cyclase [Candidatus Omnitrophota bacterium]